MTTLLSFIIFIFILFLYIHITAHYKKSEDLEIYESDYTTNAQLQEICDLRQPVLFDMEPILGMSSFDVDKIIKKSESSTIETHVKDSTDIHTHPDIAGESILLPFRSAYGLTETDSKSRFFSENNEEFVMEVLEQQMKSMNEFLKPGFTVQTKYDLIFGSDKSYTACRYHMHYRRFLFVRNGKILVKMTPWKSRKFLYPENDYTNYEFRSPMDIWNPQDGLLDEFQKTKFLEFEVLEGYILYLPPFWFYSIKFSNGENQTPAIVESYTYNSIMNLAANIPNWMMYFLQHFNTKIQVLTPKRERPSDEEEKENSSEKKVIDDLKDFEV